MKKNHALQSIYPALGMAFAVIVVMSNILSAKMIVLPFISLSIPAGLIFYPFTFLLCDLVTEIYGTKKARIIIYTSLAMNLISFGMIEIVLHLPTDILETQKAFQTVLGLSRLRIGASLIAFVTAQIIDVQLFSLIKRLTGPNFLWVRSNGSTWISQLVDTVIIDLIFLFFGLGMGIGEVLVIMLFSFSYKAVFSVLCTPLFYFCVSLLKKKREYRGDLSHVIS